MENLLTQIDRIGSHTLKAMRVDAYDQVKTALVIDYAIRAAVREGAAEFDFLRGREAYKYRWGATDRLTYRRRLRNKPASGLPSAARGHTP
jgi:Acetyltransferase (GNAT) domain